MSAYEACRDDEISFVKGAIVRLLKKYADGWWLVRYELPTYLFVHNIYTSSQCDMILI